MDKQVVFNKVATHLLTQNEKSYNDGACYYRDGTGKMCAIGCLIPDEFYDTKFEGFGLSGDHKELMNVIELSLGCTLNQHDKEFLAELQTIHDHDSVSLWKWALQVLADAYDLQFPNKVDE